MEEINENTRQYPPLVVGSVRIYPASGKDNVLAYAAVDLNGAFVIHGLRIVQGRSGPFVSMPQRMVKGEYKDEYKDVCFPCTREFLQIFVDAVLDAYESWQEGNAENGGE